MLYFTWDTWIIIQLQQAGFWLRPVVDFFTWLGYPQAYMLIIAIIYWCFNRKLGLKMALFLSLCASINSLLKLVFHAPRPYWVDMKISGMHADKGFGMPSGHAQSATVWLLAASYIKSKWFWLIAFLVTFMVGLSRTYLGVHFPTQVIAGWLAGIIIIIGFIRLEPAITTWLTGMIIAKQLLISTAGVAVIILTGILLSFLLNFWEMPATWTQNTAEYLYLDHSVLKTYGLASVCGNAGSFLGVAMGAILMKWKGGFVTNGSIWIRVKRVIIGISVLAVLFFGMRMIEPGYDEPVLNALWRFSGFYILSISAIFLVPLLLKRLKLLY